MLHAGWSTEQAQDIYRTEHLQDIYSTDSRTEQALSKHWASIEQDLSKHWASTEQALSKHWASTGHLQDWAFTGLSIHRTEQALRKHWASTEQAQDIYRTEQALSKHWASTEQAQDIYSTDSRTVICSLCMCLTLDLDAPLRVLRKSPAFSANTMERPACSIEERHTVKRWRLSTFAWRLVIFKWNCQPPQYSLKCSESWTWKKVSVTVAAKPDTCCMTDNKGFAFYFQKVVRPNGTHKMAHTPNGTHKRSWATTFSIHLHLFCKGRRPLSLVLLLIQTAGPASKLHLWASVEKKRLLRLNALSVQREVHIRGTMPAMQLIMTALLLLTFAHTKIADFLTNALTNNG